MVIFCPGIALYMYVLYGSLKIHVVCYYYDVAHAQSI